MSVGDVVVYVIAAIALVALAFIIFTSWRNILYNLFIFLAGWAIVGIVALVIGVVGAGGFLAWHYLNDRYVMKQCSTAHERRAKAFAAPDDYFGKRLREEANAEAKQCAEFAAQKEADNK